MRAWGPRWDGLNAPLMLIFSENEIIKRAPCETNGHEETRARINTTFQPRNILGRSESYRAIQGVKYSYDKQQKKETLQSLDHHELI